MLNLAEKYSRQYMKTLTREIVAQRGVAFALHYLRRRLNRFPTDLSIHQIKVALLREARRAGIKYLWPALSWENNGGILEVFPGCAIAIVVALKDDDFCGRPRGWVGEVVILLGERFHDGKRYIRLKEGEH